MMRRLLVPFLVLVLLGVVLPVGAVSAQSNDRCFPETGFCISGVIRSYWESNGGVSVFGYPTTPVQTETVETWSGPTQHFERDRLEDHSTQGQGVLAGRLGAERLVQQGRPWQPGHDVAVAGCRLYPQTGYTVCGGFLSYWDRNGGLARFGYPITGQIQETLEGHTYTVQYFERRRMEYHPENAAPYDILLGLLDNEIRASGQCVTAALPELQYDAQTFGKSWPLGCPVAGQDYSNASGASARFEHGQMYWINLRGGQAIIYVIKYGANNSVTYQLFPDTWHEGDPVNSGLKPPPGKYEPNRGFGKVWREQPGVRDALGWALENERAVTISYQVFQQGTLAQVHGENEYVTWQFASDGRARNTPT